MKRGEATRGQVAKKLAGVDVVEIKATIPDHQVELALQRRGLTKEGNARLQYFFDTPQLDLFRSGVIIRARRVPGGQHDTTIKIRPVDPETMPRLWQKYKGFKLEADASEKGIVKSASLTVPVKRGVIKKVAAGKLPIASLFTEPQLTLLLAHAKKHADLDKLVVLGPVQAWRWKVTDPALPWPMTGELWERGDQAQILEVSIKVPCVQAPAAGAGFLAFLAEAGAERDNGQMAKTRWALEFYAQHLPDKATEVEREMSLASH